MEKLILKNNLKELEKLSVFVENIGEKYQLSNKEIFEINLVLDELVTNKINYEFKDELEQVIEIIANLNENKIEIEMIDSAAEFNPLTYETDSLDKSISEKKIGGLGIFFVKEKVDELRYKRSNNKNYLYLVKYIRRNN